MPLRSEAPDGGPVVYRATLVGVARLHYVDSKSKVDHWQDLALITRIDEETAQDPWADATEQVEGYDDFDPRPAAGAKFLPVPSAALQAKNYSKWEKSLAKHLYSEQRLKLWQAPDVKEYSHADETEAEFRIRVRQRQRELRDEAVADLRQSFARKHDTLEGKVRRARERVDRETSQFQGEAAQAAVSIGTSILRALLGARLSANETSAAPLRRHSAPAARRASTVTSHAPGRRSKLWSKSNVSSTSSSNRSWRSSTTQPKTPGSSSIPSAHESPTFPWCECL